MAADSVILGIIIGVLAAILYSLRVLILVERRIARLDLNLEALVQRVFKEELKIEKEEEAIENRLGMNKSGTSTSKRKSTRKKASSRKKTAKKASSKKKATSRKKSTRKN